jgi:hypothetical protein
LNLTHYIIFAIVAASIVHADAFYSVSGMGEVVCHTIRSEVFEEIVTHKFTDPFAKDVEVAIQSRDLASAFSRVINISRTQRQEGKLLAPNENELINLCTIRPALKADSWSQAKANSSDNFLAMKTAFQKDLKEYSYCIPPRFDEFQEWTKEIPSVLRLEYDLVILRAKIVHDIMNSNWKNILRIEE